MAGGLVFATMFLGSISLLSLFIEKTKLGRKFCCWLGPKFGLDVDGDWDD